MSEKYSLNELLAFGKEGIDTIVASLKMQRNGIPGSFNMQQPAQWIEERTDLAGNKFYTNRWSLIEALMQIVFPEWRSEIEDNYVTSAKPMYAVTTRVMISTGVREFKPMNGVGTEVVDDMKLLALATPLSVITANKNAIRQLGDFFGRSLNRTTEDMLVAEKKIETPASPVRDETTIQYEVVENMLKKAPTRSAANTILLLSDFKLTAALQQIANSKPIHTED